MLLLALETSALAGSVALLEDDNCVALEMLPAGQRSAQSLAATLDRLLRQQGANPKEISLVAVTAGPGSFTGLRVGLITAKTLAYAWGCDLLGVNTLEVIARQAAEHLESSDVSRICAVMDAQRQQLFAEVYGRPNEDKLPSLQNVEIVDRATWIASLSPGDLVTGPGLTALVSQIPPGVQIAPKDLWQPTAPMVGRVAWEQWKEGKRDDWRNLAARYIRLSAAEEKRGAQPTEK